uniref:PA domain-containing protein n=1 Tax=Aplanochytrium stocchinoi TaxID=215587 RepID=A0A7S3LP13_9STRA|mmetsp:Transcript_17546/g.21252  ORF Transcript_17546/g.21252 Transcript_17546/m.21252 type:complete len:451 (+) Transcript_17546:93-1445(+)
MGLFEMRLPILVAFAFVQLQLVSAGPLANTIIEIKGFGDALVVFGTESTDGKSLEDVDIKSLEFYFPEIEAEQEACGGVSPPTSGNDFVLLASRGGCLFSQKVKEAQNIGAKGIVIINREDSLLRNGSDGVLDPCDVDCELSQSSDRTTCESNSGCPSKFCLQTLEVDLDYCCLTEDLRNMPLIFDGSNLTTAEVLIPAAFVSVVDADAIISLLATSDANNETVLVSMSIRETNRWDASVWLLMLMGTLSTALASYRAARTERMQLSWIWGSSKRGQWDEVQVVTTTQNEQGEIENEETSQRRPENGVEVEDRELNNDSPPPPSPKTHRYDDSTLEQFELTTSQGLFLVVMAAASLVGLFFAVRLYPQQIVIAIIVLYGISAIYSTSYFVMSPLFRVILPNSIAYASIKIPMNRVTKECFLMDYVTVSSILGILSSLALVVVWFVLRHGK